jgi:hypothetical protein
VDCFSNGSSATGVRGLRLRLFGPRQFLALAFQLHFRSLPSPCGPVLISSNSERAAAIPSVRAPSPRPWGCYGAGWASKAVSWASCRSVQRRSSGRRAPWGSAPGGWRTRWRSRGRGPWGEHNARITVLFCCFSECFGGLGKWLVACRWSKDWVKPQICSEFSWFWRGWEEELLVWVS